MERWHPFVGFRYTFRFPKLKKSILQILQIITHLGIFRSFRDILSTYFYISDQTLLVICGVSRYKSSMFHFIETIYHFWWFVFPQLWITVTVRVYVEPPQFWSTCFELSTWKLVCTLNILHDISGLGSSRIGSTSPISGPEITIFYSLSANCNILWDFNFKLGKCLSILINDIQDDR